MADLNNQEAETPSMSYFKAFISGYIFKNNSLKLLIDARSLKSVHCLSRRLLLAGVSDDCPLFLLGAIFFFFFFFFCNPGGLTFFFCGPVTV